MQQWKIFNESRQKPFLQSNGNGQNTDYKNVEKKIEKTAELLTFETNIRYFKRQWPKKIIRVSLQNTERFRQ